MRDTKIDPSSLAVDLNDLNACVTALLKKSKEEAGANRDVKRRQRKNKDQMKILAIEYSKNPDWSRDYIKKVSARLGLREC